MKSVQLGAPRTRTTARFGASLAVLALTLSALSACSKPEPEAMTGPATTVTAPPSAADMPTASAASGSTTVPAAATVLGTAASDVKPEAGTERANKSMSRAEESAAMPLPGQNNDHSAPATAARTASSPASSPR